MPGPNTPPRKEETLVNDIIRYAGSSGYATVGGTMKTAIIGCCDHIIALGADPYEAPKFTFQDFATAQAEAARVKTWATATL